MPKEFSEKDKREFFRYKHEKPVSDKVVYPSKESDLASKFINAVGKNLSVSGILFTSKFIPDISSVIILDLDFRTSRICQEIEERALIIKDKLVGKVVRIEINDDGTYNVGVAFVKKTEKLPDNISDIAKG